MKTGSSVLDASALLAYLRREQGFQVMVKLLHAAASSGSLLLINEVNLGEVFYITASRRSEKEAFFVLDEIVPQLPILLVQNSMDDIIRAALFKARRGLGYMDAFAAALAQREKAALFTCDQDFEKVAGEVEIRWLR